MRTSGKGSIVLLCCSWWRAQRDSVALETKMIEHASSLVVLWCRCWTCRFKLETPHAAPRKLCFHPCLQIFLAICRRAHLPSVASALLRSSSCRFRVVERAIPASTGAPPRVARRGARASQAHRPGLPVKQAGRSQPCHKVLAHVDLVSRLHGAYARRSMHNALARVAYALDVLFRCPGRRQGTVPTLGPHRPMSE